MRGQKIAILCLVFAEAVAFCEEDAICLQKCCSPNKAFVKNTCSNMSSENYDWEKNLLTAFDLPLENTSISYNDNFLCPKGSDISAFGKSVIEFLREKIYLVEADQLVAYNHSCLERFLMDGRYTVVLLACTRAQFGLQRQINVIGK